MSEPPPWASANAPLVRRAEETFFHRKEPAIAAVPSGLTFLAAVWLVVAPFVLGFAGTGRGFWIDLIIGIAIGGLALTRTVAPRKVPWLSLVNVLLGAWLAIMPLILRYHEGPDASAALANDVMVGIVVIGIAGASAAITLAAGSEGKGRHAPR